MRTDFACTERVVICPRNSPETFLNVPILAMMHSLLGSGRTIAASLRTGRRRGPDVAAAGPQRSGGPRWLIFLFSRVTAARRWKTVVPARLHQAGESPPTTTKGPYRDADEIGTRN